MRSPNSLPRGALLGVGLGLALSGLLLVLLLIAGRGEGSEYWIWMMAVIAGLPMSFVLKQLGWIDQASSLVVYVLLVVPLNWAFVGATVGGIVQLGKGRHRT